MKRMMLVAGALLVALAGDAFAQAEKIDEPLDPGRMGVAREQSGPAGDLLSQRAPPGSADARTDQPRGASVV